MPAQPTTRFCAAKRFADTPLRYAHELTEQVWLLSEDLLRAHGFAV